MLSHKDVGLTDATITDLGHFEAIAATWSVDRQNERSSRAPSRTRSRRGGTKVARFQSTGAIKVRRQT